VALDESARKALLALLDEMRTLTELKPEVEAYRRRLLAGDDTAARELHRELVQRSWSLITNTFTWEPEQMVDNEYAQLAARVARILDPSSGGSD
jgi:hypothetical protein